ncbi:Pyrroline-5-carboxylate reductase [hydrothermal vent metagenome]|uniref:Pyrroline-5-carboxylate reductase n=1 Tax=hydrothermal vent metagenome TaxID=652676 RepID=A0A3B1D6Y2_9ZZZZ
MTGFIGGGNMAEAIINGLLGASGDRIIVADKKKERLDYLKKRYRIKTTADSREVLSAADVVILAVKPADIGDVTAEIRDGVTDRHLVVSIAAGVKLEYLSGRLKTKRLFRVMPNAPAFAGEGMSVVSPLEGTRKKDLKTVVDMFRTVGEVMVLSEDRMDAVTALSGSGPAFFAYFVESMAEAGVRIGLSASDALALTLQTALGTIKMLKQGQTPAELKQMVTSPGGTTAEGLYRLERNSLKAAVKEAVEAAARRAEELSGRQ